MFTDIAAKKIFELTVLGKTNPLGRSILGHVDIIKVDVPDGRFRFARFRRDNSFHPEGQWCFKESDLMDINDRIQGRECPEQEWDRRDDDLNLIVRCWSMRACMIAGLLEYPKRQWKSCSGCRRRNDLLDVLLKLCQHQTRPFQ